MNCVLLSFLNTGLTLVILSLSGKMPAFNDWFVITTNGSINISLTILIAL